MAWDYSKLNGRIKECGLNQTLLAKKVNIGVSTLSEKLNNKYPFTMKEIDAICKTLSISKEEIGVYFFAEKVQKS
jgi:transcriptional regulator with XRE-family HTH domain